MNAVHREARRARCRTLDTESYDVDVDQHGEIGGHDLQQVLETRSPQHRQHRLVHAALARKIAAARRDQALLLVLQPGEIAAQSLQHEMLEIEDAVADDPAGGAQQSQRIRVAVEEIGMLAQIGDDLAGADLGRPHRRRQTAAQRLRLILRTIGHAYFRGVAPRRRPNENTAAGQCAIIRKPP